MWPLKKIPSKVKGTSSQVSKEEQTYKVIYYKKQGEYLKNFLLSSVCYKEDVA